MNKSDLAASADEESYFGLSASDLAARKSLHTAQEIYQQPRVWREAYANVERDRIAAWLTPKLEMNRIRVLFCGAGTSAFIGDCVAAWLRSHFDSSNPVDFEAVSTTDLVADPTQFLRDDRPTIVVSFGRSGDSPESVATVALADQLLTNCYHLIITCNPEGSLANFASDNPSAICLLMPEGTNDRGFAMTSSFSSMLVSCLAVFAPSSAKLDRTAECAELLITRNYRKIAKLADANFDRLVVLGSGALNGAAKESALKCLELAAGKLTVTSDSPLGFRHGPKIVVSSKTMVVVMRSADHYIRRYDDDLLDELRGDDQALEIVELSTEALFPNQAVDLSDIWLSLIYVVHCQILAFLNSYKLGVTVDSPCPSGEVNRVVQGVTIHPYNKSDT